MRSDCHDCRPMCHPERTREGSGIERLVSQILRGVPLRMTLVGFLLAGIAGCHSPRKGEPVAKEFSGSDPDAQVGFWHNLTDKPVTSNDEAFHGILLYTDGKDDSTDYQARVAAMKTKKMLPAGWDQPADQAATRGTVAVALMKVIQNKGGITMHLL